ncbi:MAG: SDR family NAD(P)-dependent oxidoreductase [Lachnospiraceae bacterium]|nr:SDR family NAD(P)-dependent oxidoreductase [Lachnospiraceae bacterium]
MKKIVITGASRGIGRDTALLLAQKGFDLVLVSSRSEYELNELKNEIEEKYGVSATVVTCDVSDADAVKAHGSEFKGAYALINNAAISSVKLLNDLSYEEWNRVIDVNLNSVFYMTKAVLDDMISRKEGKIINISSVWGSVGASMEVAYSSAKGGVNAFTKALAKELGPSNIQVNAVSFGVIDTSMNKCFSKEDMKALKDEIPMDRIGTPLEAAKMIVNVFESPDYMTGQIITMDGGWI